MAGMIEQKMAGEGPGADGTAAHESGEAPAYEKQEGPEAGAGGEFTPEQKTELEAFSLAGQHALFDEKSGVSGQLAEAMKGAPDASQALCDFTYALVGMIDEKSGAKLDDELLAPAAADILGQVVEVAQAAGTKVGSREIAKATQLMLAKFFAESGASPDDVQKFMGAANPDDVGAHIDQQTAGQPPADPTVAAPPQQPTGA